MQSSEPPSYEQHIAAAAAPNDQHYLTRFKSLMQKYEIHDYFASKLRQLEGYDIVFVCDDSGSMNSPVTTPNSSPYAPTVTRWMEMKKTVSIVVEIANVLDKDGVDIYFLNRPSLHNVHDLSELTTAFAEEPCGSTPITRTVRKILHEKNQGNGEKKLLIVIATDGEPTNDSGRVDTQELKRLLQSRNSRVHVSFVACTDDDSTMNYLNSWDEQLSNLDVCDDFASEREEILKAQGAHFHFSMGDYIVKILLGSIDPELDNLDEKSPNKKSQTSALDIFYFILTVIGVIILIRIFGK